jgi:ice-binding like protein
VSNRTLKRTGRVGVALAVGCAFAAVPVSAQAAAVNLGTVSPFVVLGGSTVTNTGPSVLNGDLGVAPGTALTGFGLPAVVNGATHDNDGVANQAKADLGTAYDVAAGQPVSGANDLTGTDLGNRVLTAGAYRYTSSAQLTGPLTLDAAGDPNAQFVFEIASKLTTASASSVVLVNGASPCNVFWQVGTSATLGSTTAFKGNLMALASISLNNAVTVQGRMLARNGQISLINDVIDGSMCGTSSSAPTPTPTTGGGTSPTAGAPVNQAPPASRSAIPTHNGTAKLRRPPTVTASRRPPGAAACTAGFHATVRGHLIRRVVFSLDGKRIGTRTSPAFRVYVHAAGGRHVVSARVGFKDATHSKTVKFRYRACAAQVLRPRRGPSQFTG